MKQKQYFHAAKPIRTPEQRDERRGFGYALLGHALLILLMLFGLAAAPSNPNPVQIELWAEGTTPTAAEPDAQPDTPKTPPEEASPPKPVPPPQPEPEPAKPIPPAPAPAPVAPPPPPAPAPAETAPEPEPPQIDPDIALEKARKEQESKEKAARLIAEKKAVEKALAEKKAKEKAAAEKAAEEATAQKKAKETAAKKAAAEEAAKEAAEEKAAAAKAAEQAKIEAEAKAEAEAEKAATEKAAAQKKAKEIAAKKAVAEKAAAAKAKEEAAEEAAKEAAEEKAAAEKKAKEAAAKKAAADKKAKEAAAEKAAAAKRDALKQAMRSDALGAAGIPGGSADRNQSGGGGSDNGYAAQVRACIRPRVAYPVPPRTGSNPTVQYRANLNAQGIVTGVQVQRSSGIAAFDRAVATGIQSCSPFPKPPSGKYPSYVDGDYRMYD